MKISNRILSEIIKGYQKLGVIQTADIKIKEDKIELFGIYNFSYNDVEIKRKNDIVLFDLADVSKVSNRSASVFIEFKKGTYFEIDTPKFSVFSDILKELLFSQEHFSFALTNIDYYSNLNLSESNIKDVLSNEGIQNRLKVLSFIETKQFSRAESELNSLVDFSSIDVLYYSSLLKLNKAKFNNEPRLFYDALELLLNIYRKCSNRVLFNILKKTYLQYRDNFLNLSISNRKFLYVTDGFHDFSSKSFTVLLHKVVLPNNDPLKHLVDVGDINLPSELEFPIGHPKNNTMYVVHPYNDKYYIPIDVHEHILFNDRIAEFNNLVQALGAVEINYIKINKAINEQTREENINGSANLSGKIYKAGIDFNETNSQRRLEEDEVGYRSSQRFAPTVKPHLPERIVWYSKETAWQRLFAQRTNGNNLLEHVEEFNSKSFRTVSLEELVEIKAELKIFLNSANVETKIEEKEEVKEQKEESQRIEVKFAPIDDLTIQALVEVNEPLLIKPYRYFNATDFEWTDNNVDFSVLNSLLISNEINVSKEALEDKASSSSILGKNIRIPIFPEYNIYLDMIYVQGGSFNMGTEDKEALKISPGSTRKYTSVKSFYISKYLFTNDMCTKLSNGLNYFNYYSKAPVSPINLIDTLKVIDKLNQKTNLIFTLPTEKQWEYAARGGIKSKHYKYSGSNDLNEVGYFKRDKEPKNGNISFKNIPVGNKKANELGIYDMSGLMDEWCYNGDELQEYVNHIERAEALMREKTFMINLILTLNDDIIQKYHKGVLRGGNYFNDESDCTVYHRFETSLKNAYVGSSFRVVLSVEEVQKLTSISSDFLEVKHK